MSMASLIRSMADAGASSEVIAIVIEHIENDTPKPAPVADKPRRGGLIERRLARVLPAADKVLDETCAKYSVSKDSILAQVRFPEIVAPRQEVMWRLRTELGCSFPVIAKFLGRDHTTIMHGVRAHQLRLDTSAEARQA